MGGQIKADNCQSKRPSVKAHGCTHVWEEEEEEEEGVGGGVDIPMQTLYTETAGCR